MVFRNGNNFFFGRTPPVRNGNLVVLWPVMGLGHLEKFQARAENRKTQFPGARGPEMKKKFLRIWDGFPQLFYNLCFGRPSPQGREIAKYGDLRPFWPRKAFGTERNLGRGLKTEKHNFPALGVLKSKKKLPRYLGWLSATFLRLTFGPTGPPRAGNRKVRVF